MPTGNAKSAPQGTPTLKMRFIVKWQVQIRKIAMQANIYPRTQKRLRERAMFALPINSKTPPTTKYSTASLNQPADQMSIFLWTRNSKREHAFHASLTPFKQRVFTDIRRVNHPQQPPPQVCLIHLIQGVVKLTRETSLHLQLWTLGKITI